MNNNIMDLSTSKRSKTREIQPKTEFKSPITSPLLPPESWERVLSKLPPSDVLSAINTCPEWRQLQLEKRRTVLLPLVLEIVGQYISTNDILKLRLVNKHFKRVVDDLLQQYSVSPFKSLDRDEPQWRSCSWRRTCSVSTKISLVEQASFLRSLADYEKLTSKFPNSTQGNPFLTGHLKIADSRWIQDRGSDEKIRTLVTDFGVNISSFHFSASFNHITTLTLFAVLDGKLPNLKILNLDGTVERPCVEWFRNCPSSKLENLECLDLTRFSVDRDTEKELACLPFLILFRCYGSQLKVLHVDEKALDFPEIDIDFLNTNLANLQCFNIKLNSFKVLEKLWAVSWHNLHRLELSGYSGDFTFVDVLKLINKFATQLTHLRLDYYNIKVGTLEPSMMQKLPKLKKFKAPLSLNTHAWLWIFLMISCQNLEEIEFIVSSKHGNQIWDSKKAFGYVPKLRRIVAWDDVRSKKYIFRRGHVPSLLNNLFRM